MEKYSLVLVSISLAYVSLTDGQYRTPNYSAQHSNGYGSRSSRYESSNPRTQYGYVRPAKNYGYSPSVKTSGYSNQDRSFYTTNSKYGTKNYSPSYTSGYGSSNTGSYGSKRPVKSYQTYDHRSISQDYSPSYKPSHTTTYKKPASTPYQSTAYGVQSYKPRSAYKQSSGSSYTPVRGYTKLNTYQSYKPKNTYPQKYQYGASDSYGSSRLHGTSRSYGSSNSHGDNYGSSSRSYSTPSSKFHFGSSSRGPSPRGSSSGGSSRSPYTSSVYGDDQPGKIVYIAAERLHQLVKQTGSCVNTLTYYRKKNDF